MVDAIRRLLLITGLTDILLGSRVMADQPDKPGESLTVADRQRRELSDTNYEKVTGKPRPECRTCYLYVPIQDPSISSIALSTEFKWGICFALPPAKRTSRSFVKEFEMCPSHQDFIKIKQKEMER